MPRVTQLGCGRVSVKAVTHRASGAAFPVLRVPTCSRRSYKRLGTLWGSGREAGRSLCEQVYPPPQGPGRAGGLSRADNVPDSIWVPRTLWEPTMDGHMGARGYKRPDGSGEHPHHRAARGCCEASQASTSCPLFTGLSYWQCHMGVPLLSKLYPAR